MVSLYDWFLHYLKQKDLHFGHIKEIKQLDEGFFFILKMRKGDDLHELGYVHSDFTKELNFDSVIKGYEEEKKKDSKLKFSYFAVFNTTDNLKFADAFWDKFVEYRDLKLYFIHPYSDLKIWAINPFSHSFVNGSKKALKVFFDTLGAIKEADIKKFEKDKI